MENEDGVELCERCEQDVDSTDDHCYNCGECIDGECEDCVEEEE